MQKNFNGARLSKARIYRGFTTSELAEKIDCQRQTISMYENGKSKPIDYHVIQKLSEVLEFPVKFFMEEDIDLSVGSTYFRALLTTKKKYRKEQVSKMEFVSQIFNFLNEYIQFPTLDLPDFDGCNPEEAATRLREYWQLGTKPIENIIYEVEQRGILVTSFSTNTDDVDAFSQMVDINGKEKFLIGFTSNKTSAARIHFDIAHELGHICLHDWYGDVEELEREEFKRIENEANQFASAFLLPEDAFKKDTAGKELNIPNYIDLKNKWKVSIQAMNYRAHKLGIISYEKYQNMIRTLQRRGYRKSEPLDNSLIPVMPSMLRVAIVMLLSEKVFTPKEFMDELSFSHNLSLYPKEIEYLLDLPEDTLAFQNVSEFPTLKIIPPK
ncbi:MAG: XRE family transcriptional regulator [Bacillota bacterium]